VTLEVTKLPWKWTKKKRKAIQMVIKGLEIKEIAKSLGVSGRTIIRWKLTKEFQDEMIHQAHEYTNRKRFRRVYETGVIADQLGHQTAKHLKKLTDGELDQVGTNQLQMLLREYREFQSVERTHFGDDGVHIEHRFTFGNAKNEVAKESIGNQNFKKFLEEHMNLVPQRVLQNAQTPIEGLIAATREIMKKTNVLDQLHEEDKAIEEQERRDKDKSL
jgi:hypothetical protein